MIVLPSFNRVSDKNLKDFNCSVNQSQHLSLVHTTGQCISEIDTPSIPNDVIMTSLGSHDFVNCTSNC